MHRFWKHIIGPILEDLQPKVIVEIGSGSGVNTLNLLEYARRRGAVVHAIDPQPAFDVTAMEQEWGNQLVFHRTTSLEALPSIEEGDAVLIDGDHNWYTVFNELTTLRTLSAQSGRPFPLVFLHDVGWPYGRRDMYYAPDGIPEDFRRPFARRGIAPDTSELLDDGGFNRHLAHSTTENEPQSGVLTAAQDFLRHAPQELDFVLIPGFHGLGILISSHLIDRNKALGLRIRTLANGLLPNGLAEDLEIDRIHHMVRVGEADRYSPELERAESESERLRQTLEQQRSHEKVISTKLEEVSRRADDLARVLSQTALELERLQQSNARLVETRDRLDAWLGGIDVAFNFLLSTKRWQIGNALGKLWRRVTLRPSVDDPSALLIPHFRAYRQWKGVRDSGDVRVFPRAGEPDADDVRRAKDATRDVHRTFSVILPTHNRMRTLGRAIDSCIAQSLDHWELIVVDDGSTDDTADFIAHRYQAELASGQMKFLRQPHRGVCAARNLALAQASGDWIAYLDSDDAWNKHYLLMVAEALALDPRAKTAYSFMRVNDGINASSYVRSESFDFGRLTRGNFISLIAYSHDKCLVDELGTFDEALTRFVDWDLILRQTREYRPVLVPYILADAFTERNLASISNIQDRHSNEAIVRAKASRGPLRVAIKCPSPPPPEGLKWGDFHYARALRRALLSKGVQVRIDYVSEWSRSAGAQTDEICLVIRGISRYQPVSGQTNVLWIISHPEEVTLQECSAYDYILAASNVLADDLRSSLSTPVETMLQFTDPCVFFPAEDPQYAHEVLFVGNSRGHFRDVLRMCVDLRLNVSVYGSNWKGLIPDTLVKGEYIPNEELHKYYASSKIVLNDHWAPMREFGIISNRILDVGAAGGFVVSDRVDGMVTHFGTSVPTYDNKADLDRLIHQFLVDPEARAQKAHQLRREVLENFTVERRATRLNSILNRLHRTRKGVLQAAVVHPNSPNKPSPSTHVRLLRRFAHKPEHLDFYYESLTPGSVIGLGGSFEWMFDLAIVHRQGVHPNEVEAFLRTLSMTSTPLVYDIDDYLPNVPRDVDISNEYVGIRSSVEALARNASLLTVSTRALATALGTLNPNIRVVPNTLDDDLWFPSGKTLPLQAQPRTGSRILYMGSMTHDRDLQLVYGPLKKLVEEEENVTFHVIGGSPRLPTWVSRVPIPSGMENYPKFVGWFLRQAQEFDIAIAPLEDNEFNGAKSAIKYMEYSAAGLPGVYSRVGEYPTTVRNGETGQLTENAAGNWFGAIQQLVRSPELRRVLAQKAYEDVFSNHRMSPSIGAYYDLLCLAARTPRHTSRA